MVLVQEHALQVQFLKNSLCIRDIGLLAGWRDICTPHDSGFLSCMNNIVLAGDSKVSIVAIIKILHKCVVFVGGWQQVYKYIQRRNGDIMTERVSEDMIIADMLKLDPGIGPILMASGMHCIGCPASQGESLAEAAVVHGLEAGKLVETVNEYLANK